MYHFIDRLHTLYGLLQDEQSKEIFRTRFAIDMEKSVSNVKHLASLGNFKDQLFMRWLQPQKGLLEQLNRENKKIVLYGTAYTGQLVAEMLQSEHIGFYGFCGRAAERFPDGLLGKPVLSPEDLVAHRYEYYVVPTVGRVAYSEISEFLRKNNYPEGHILDWVGRENAEQYFEFPELYRRGTAFIDGGCYDCETSREFVEWCEGAYSSIIAFEPDPDNYAKCCKSVQDIPLPNFQIVNAGLSDREATVEFDARNRESSRIISPELPAAIDMAANANTKNKITISTVSIDDIVDDRAVGFIKLDIEGAEFDALHGAKNTILRDKPLLAICVYHLRGDVFAIMDYLHQLLPEYRFLLRHYGARETETVLYASVNL